MTDVVLLVFSETSDCRFCGSVKETFEHLTCCCTRLPTDLQRPTFDTTDFGPNFATLGLVEVSCDQIQYKLHNSQTSQLSVSPWSSDASDWNHVWTDGSCAYQESFWDTIGAYAVISNTGAVLSSGCVRHWVLSSYSCELWAGIAAWAHASSPLVIHSDCKAFVESQKSCCRLNKLIKNGLTKNGGMFSFHLCCSEHLLPSRCFDVNGVLLMYLNTCQ